MIGGIALVTGGGSGIGRDCVLAYANEGVRGIVIADIDEKAALSTANASRELAVNADFEALAVRVDVSNEESVNNLMDKTIKTFGRIDYFVNSAGVGVTLPAEIGLSSVEEFERFFQVNTKGTFLCVRAATQAMKQQEPKIVEGRLGPRHIGRGVIINMASCNAFMATPNITQYTVAKHAVLGMTRNAALDNAKYGIRVVAVCPSWVDTPMVDRAMAGDPSLKPLIERAVPLGRIASAEEVSDVVMFLSSHKASYITGVGWIVDGGATLTVHV
ncbi:hypothetical protein F4779DRAFT_595045 [Xylariaceae sp. FL0662B]|nr:hypothetical protein F4779DRAFT_595045 [Xylariaceae sp. FL0662B]